MPFRAFLAAAALLTAAHAAQPTLRLAPCHIPAPQATTGCGTFLVPENRAVKGGRMLPLKVVVIPARRQPAKQPVFFLSGGPGQAATDLASHLTADYWEIQDHDMVMV